MAQQRNYMSVIVGQHFRPPAKAVLEHLPAGAPLILEPEDGNQYDAYAVKVLVRPEAVPESELDALREQCSMMGAEWEELALAAEPLWLGYIISANNKKLGAWTPNTVIRDIISAGNWEAKLAFSERGEPVVLTVVTEVEDGSDDIET